MASSLACLYSVLLTFVEGECMRQVHPWQTLMTSEEVPLLRAPKFHSLLHPAGNSEQTVPAVCVCVWLSQSMFFFFQQPCAERETLHVF